MITADSNVVIYAYDHRDIIKQAIAKDVLQKLINLKAPLALQVIGEVQNVLRRKLRFSPNLAADRAGELLEAHPTFPATAAAARLALAQVARGHNSYWDALLLASAAEAGCTVMLTEDLQDGARLFGLEIVNPFAPDGISPRAAEVLNLT